MRIFSVHFKLISTFANIRFDFCVCFFLPPFFLQRNLYASFKRTYFPDDDSTSDGKSSRIGDETVCSIDSLYEDKLDESDDDNDKNDSNRRESVHTTSPSKLREPFEQVIAGEMGDVMENNNDDGGNDAARKMSMSEETEKDDKFPQQMATGTKNANWNTMELGEKRKRLR